MPLKKRKKKPSSLILLVSLCDDPSFYRCNPLLRHRNPLLQSPIARTFFSTIPFYLSFTRANIISAINHLDSLAQIHSSQLNGIQHDDIIETKFMKFIEELRCGSFDVGDNYDGTTRTRHSQNSAREE
ncbi:unnamed protein product [Lathyrus sativus]|nr:unnamed protein product [Lathyrus sativus]